jgi:hypothetical protein
VLLERIEAFQREMQTEFRETQAAIRLSYAELDRRITRLEAVTTDFDSRLSRLERERQGRCGQMAKAPSCRARVAAILWLDPVILEVDLAMKLAHLARGTGTASCPKHGRGRIMSVAIGEAMSWPRGSSRSSTTTTTRAFRLIGTGTRSRRPGCPSTSTAVRTAAGR